MRRPTSPPVRCPAVSLRVEPLEARVTPATFTVTNLNSSGANSLAWAISGTTASSGPDEIVFDPSLFATPQTIDLTQSLPEINPVGSIVHAVTITGPGADLLTIMRDSNAGSTFPMFNVEDGNVTLTGLTIDHGDGGTTGPGGIYQRFGTLTLENVVISNNKGYLGGGVGTMSASVAVRNSTFTNNQASEGGGVYVSQGGVLAIDSTFTGDVAAVTGGGIYLRDGTVHTQDTIITGNQAVQGGGIYMRGGTLDVQTTTITSNTAASGGGGIYVRGDLGGEGYIQNSTISGNVSDGFGGGVYFRQAYHHLDIENCTISGNSAVGGGGGIFLREVGSVNSNDPPGIIRNCTIVGNTAGKRGGGVEAATLDTPLKFENCTITGNTSTDSGGAYPGGGGVALSPSGGGGTMEILDSVVSGNHHPTAPDLLSSVQFPIEVQFSAIGSSLGWTPAVTSGANLPFGIDVALGPLQNNGGPTLTMHPAFNSPLVDAGSDALVEAGVTTDQRGPGFPRIAGSSVDIGAVELQPVTVVVNQAAGQPDPTNTGPISFTVTFNTPVTGFTASGVDFTGSTAGGSLQAAVSGSGTDYTIAVTGMTTSGDVVVSVPAGAAQGALGIPNEASTSTDNVVQFDVDAPTATIDLAAGQTDPTSVDPIRFDVEFGEPVTGFDATDVSLAGTTVGGSLTTTLTGSGASYTVSVSGMTGTGVVTISVPAGAAQDAAGNLSLAATAIHNSVTFEQFPPTVTINQAADQPDPTNGPIQFDVQFSAPVSGFDPTDIVFTGSTVGGTLSAAISGSGAAYVVTVNGMTGAGKVVASIPAGAATDAIGLGNLASTSTDNVVNFDGIDPTVTVNPSAGQADPTNTGPIVFDVAFSKPVTGFTASAVSFAGSTVGGTLQASVSGSGADYTVSVTGMHGLGTVVLSIPAGVATDAVGNGNTASTGGNNSVTYDNVGTVGLDLAVVPATEGSPALVTVTRSAGSDGQVSIDYATADGTAVAGTDYTASTGTLTWADGEAGTKTITVPIANVGINEGRETFNLTLSNSVGTIHLGPTATVIQIAKSDGVTIQGAPPKGQKPSSTFTDADGDKVTISLGGKTGALTYYLTDGKGPISEIDLSGTDPTKSTISIKVVKPKGGTGDGRVGIEEVDGTGFKTFTAKTGDLIGTGFNLTGFAGSIKIGNVSNGAAFNLPGTVPAKTPKAAVKITAGAIADGTAITVAAPVKSLMAASIGAAMIAAPSIATLTAGTVGIATINTAVVGSIAVKGNFGAHLTISGAGLPAGATVLKALKVGGAVTHGTIDAAGNIGSVMAGAFHDSNLYAGYNAALGTFPVAATVGTFKVTGKVDGFANSDLFASTFKNVMLESVQADNGGTKFGVYAHTAIKAMTVPGASFKYDPTNPGPQGLPPDFETRLI